MTNWETLQCVNHPERIALERCEVCGKPLCAYCLYYTEDGQRLCRDHAAIARQRGIAVEEPGAYADQLIGAQAGAIRKQKRESDADDGLYKGNSTDLYAFLSMLFGIIMLGACCGAIYCLPVVGVLLSIVALLNAKKAYDVRRTRRLAVIGLLTSGAWVVIMVGCIAFYGITMASVFNTMQSIPIQTLLAPTSTHTPTPTVLPAPDAAPNGATGNPTDTPEPTRDLELDALSLTETALAPTVEAGAAPTAARDLPQR